MFKRGARYSRDEIHATYFGVPMPKIGTGNWTTGYVRPKDTNDLIVFMNIGIPGKTGHDFENFYDEQNNTLIWFSKPRAHSEQPTFKQIFAGELKPLFFARWKKSDSFTFLGTGQILHFEDGYVTPQGYSCMKMVVNIVDLGVIIKPNAIFNNTIDEANSFSTGSSFLFERHLEDFLIANWDRTPLANEYEIFKQDGVTVGQQYRTDTGPIDILGRRRDQTDFLVVELKRDRASDVVVVQILRSMGWVQEHLCGPNQHVSGCIIAQRKDQKLEYALKQVNTVQFLKYEVDFRLV